MIRQLVLVGLGGALGALLRYGAGLLVARAALPAFHGTLLVNTAGSLLIGALSVAVVERAWLHPDFRYLLIVGLLGAFTTFSAFSLETVTMLEQGRWPLAGLYVLGSVLFCIVACGIGAALARGAFSS